MDLLLANSSKLIVAGGFIRSCIANEPVNDIDLFTATPELAEELALQVAGDSSQIRATDNAYTVKVGGTHVQFVHRWTFSEPAQQLESFDFTIGAAAIWCGGVEDKWRSGFCGIS